ncbi:MAG: hypothetical protein K0S06_3372 [Microvirga sp.]|nr:hypothetical protein [Microvirga sp.]
MNELRKPGLLGPGADHKGSAAPSQGEWRRADPPAALSTMPHRDLTRLLGRCLAFDLDPSDLHRLRTQLLSSPDLWQELTDFATHEALVHALERRLHARGLLPSQFLPGEAAAFAPDGQLRTAAAALSKRREVLGEQLREIIKPLNRIGIQPIILKGARSLLTGEPDWRYLRDFDLLIPDQADAAFAEFVARGFEVPQAEQGRNRRHHLPPLVRGDFPAFIEIHRRAGNQYVRTLLPTEELAAASEAVEDGGVKFALLPTHLHTLYGLVHHQIGHAGDARGTISLKGLYEFAWELDRMTSAERAALHARANRNPRLSTALDAWIAAAAELYGLPVERPLAVREDAAQRWQATFARIGEPRPWYKYPGYPDEVRMALAGSRIQVAPFGGNAAGRAWTRLRVLRSFLPRFTK